MQNNISFSAADILLPKKDLSKWAVIACDQYTSEPHYWEKVKGIVADTESAYNLILPEVYLQDDNSGYIAKINDNMRQYLQGDVFCEYKDALIFVERIQSDGRKRLGIVGKIDLSSYDYLPGSDAEIRATEKTVISRIPARVDIRKGASLEMPHAMLLYDDESNSVMDIIEQNKEDLTEIYNFPLMLGGGSIKGSLIGEKTKKAIFDALAAIKNQNGGLLFCVGDGNHSLAAAKECYNQSQNKNAKYALCEIVNIHDSALQFEPIYRIVFGQSPETLIDAFKEYCDKFGSADTVQEFECVYGDVHKSISVKATSKLAVGTLQAFLDLYAQECEIEVDYIHGEESLCALSKGENAVGFLFGGMQKSELFPAVYSDGSLPRKTFSMGHADDKRFYLEARKISD